MNLRLALPLLCAAFAACSDSQRRAVAVEQQPAPDTIATDTAPPPPPPVPPLRVSPKQVAFDALNDTVRLAIPEGAECRSAADAVASVEQGNLIRAIGNGTTHVRCWLDGRSGSASVKVTQSLARLVIIGEQGFNIRRSGDSVRLGLQPTDRLGRMVETPAAWQSLSPEVVRVEPSGVVYGVADSGRARIVAQAGEFSDTVVVEIGAKTSAAQLLSSSSRNASRARLLARQRSTTRPTMVAGPGGVINQSATSSLAVQNPNQVQGVNARPIMGTDSLFRDPASGMFGQRRYVVPFGAARIAEHRVILAGDSLARTAGLLIGGGVDILTRGLLSFRFQFLAGTVGAEDSLARDRTVMDAAFDVGFALTPWLNIVGGASARRYEDFAIERFLSLRAGGEANFSLGGGPLRGIARLLIMPLVSIASSNGTVESPSFGLVSALGLGFENARLSSSLVYEIERYSFPNTVGRNEQFGSLLFRFGYKVGW